MTFFKLHTLVFCFVPTLLAAKHTPALPTQNLFNVRAFGAVGDGVHLDTSAIAAAIKAAAAAGGGTVVFTPGTYRAGTFEILSNVSLDLEPGSILQASADISDYM